jgi:HAD superfamily hydrolase (TIGR01509 family)
MFTLPKPHSTQVAAVMFDMDGVVADNTCFHHTAWHQYTREALGIELPEDAPQHFYGRTHEVVERLLGRPLSEAEARMHHEGKESLYRELAKGRVQMVRGISLYLSWLSERGIPAALVTNSDALCMEFVLQELGFADRFAIKINSEHVINAKPDPEPYLLAAAKLGVVPSACLIHEDTVGGVRAGLAAGAAVAALTTTVGASALLEAGAHWAVADFFAWLAMIESVNTTAVA